LECFLFYIRNSLLGEVKLCHRYEVKPFICNTYIFYLTFLFQSILIFPSDDAEDAAEFMERIKKENDGQFPFERVIFVDSTWNQTYKICHDPKVVSKFY